MKKFDLNTPLIDFGNDGVTSIFTIKQAVTGLQIWGSAGSGKTSSSGRCVALKYLAADFGGLVLTCKPDEKDLWVSYCKETGRSRDLIIVEPFGKYQFDFLKYLSTHSHNGTSNTENILDALKTVIRASEEKSSGKSDDGFWESALDMLMHHVIDLCVLAYDKVSVELLYEITMSLPKSSEAGYENSKNETVTSFQKAFNKAKGKVTDAVADWFRNLPLQQRSTLVGDDELYNETILDVIPNARLLKSLTEFFFETFKELSDKTRSIIEFSFSGFLFRLLREPVYSLFCSGGNLNFTPEDSLEGKIILLNIPVKLYHKIGRDSQILFKYMWQVAMEKRNTHINGRPVFLWADESQNFLHEHDAVFQATARSSRVATVYITQNLPNYYAAMGGDKSQHKVKAFLGTLNTKIFHANGCADTNEYASKLIGDAFFEEQTKSMNVGEKPTRGQSTGYKLARLVRPEEFMSLKCGGTENHLQVQGIVHRIGVPFANGFNHKKINFYQNFKIEKQNT